MSQVKFFKFFDRNSNVNEFQEETGVEGFMEIVSKKNHNIVREHFFPTEHLVHDLIEHWEIHSSNTYIDELKALNLLFHNREQSLHDNFSHKDFMTRKLNFLTEGYDYSHEDFYSLLELCKNSKRFTTKKSLNYVQETLVNQYKEYFRESLKSEYDSRYCSNDISLSDYKNIFDDIFFSNYFINLFKEPSHIGFNLEGLKSDLTKVLKRIDKESELLKVTRKKCDDYYYDKFYEYDFKIVDFYNY